MKKNFVYAMMSAIALTGAVCLTSCSSNEEVADVNPTFDGNSVRTDFAFNITKASQAVTRMSDKNVQEPTTANPLSFRGMQHMFLLPFSGVPAASTTTNANIFALGSLTTSEISSSQSKKIYSLTLPIGTSDFLFYGTAANETSLTNKQIGKITSTLWPSGTDLLSNATMSTDGISFSLSSIDDNNKLNKEGDATTIINYLSTIAQSVDADDATLSWKSTVGKAETEGAYRALATLYNALTTRPGEARSGSAESIKRMVFDLYKSACAINKESSVTNVQKIAKAICKSIESTSSGITLSVKYGTDDINIASVTEAQIQHADNWEVTMTGINEDFPAKFGLPMGAAQLSFDTSTSTFSFNTGDAPATNLIVGSNFSVDLSKVDYPAELIYFDNSPLRATDNYKTPDDFPSTTTTWDTSDAANSTAGFTSDWTKDATVQSSTRAVAMQNNVNYGVALLESTVKLASGVTTMTDNKSGVLKGTAENQTNIDPKKFNVTGILIGGQPGTVNWKMVNASTSFNHIIYDSDVQYGIDPNVTAKQLSTTASSPNYTVVFDNYTDDGTQDDVLIALELVNGDQDFYGKHNLIPAGSTFYLVGKLERITGTLIEGTGAWTARHPAGYRLTNESVCRVFCQDYKTKADISLSATALQNAYSTIPDLISTETVFGLSVDLKWEPGVKFNVVI